MTVSIDSKAPPLARGAWTTLAVLSLIYCFHYVDRAVFSVVLEPLKEEFSLSDSQLGLLTGIVYALTYALAGIPLGLLIDRVNRKRLLAGLLVVWSGATALCGLTQSYAQLVVARFAVGAAESGGAPASMSMISDVFPSERRSTAFGVFWSSTAFAAALTFIIGGWVVQQWGWRAAFLIAGGPGLILAVLLMLVVKEPRRGAMDDAVATDERAPDVFEALREVLSRPMVVAVFVAMTLSSIVASGTLVWIVSVLMRTQNMSITAAGLVAGGAAVVCGTSGTYFGGVLADKIAVKDRARIALVPAVASVVAVAAELTLAAAPTMFVAIGAYALFELTFRTSLGPGYSLLLGPVPPRTRGLLSSTMQLSTNLIGWGCGPLIVGTVSDLSDGPESLRYGIAGLAIVNVFAAAAFFLAWWLGRKRGDGDGARAVSNE